MDLEKEARFVQAALDIIKGADQRGIILRLMGATSVKLHCPQFARLYAGMERSLTDIDFASYGRCRPGMKEFFMGLGYEPNERIIAYYGRHRHIYWSQENQWTADIFFDDLKMCHNVSFRGRLELDYPTITLTDILLEKMQICKINAKDIKDTIVLLREHAVGSGEKEMVNADYIARTLAQDWGYWYTVTTNLNLTKGFLGKFEALNEDDRRDIAGKIDALLSALDAAPKSVAWKMRAKVGTRKKWYNEVEEVGR